MSPALILLFVDYFGWVGLVGFGLGALLLGTAVKDGRLNILDQEPWHPVAGGIVGGLGLWLPVVFLVALF